MENKTNPVTPQKTNPSTENISVSSATTVNQNNQNNLIVPVPVQIDNTNNNNNINNNNNSNNNNNNININNIEPENNDDEDNDEDLEVVSVLMSKILKTHFNFQIFFLFILSYLLWEMPLYIIFSISWLNDLLNLIFYLQKLLKMKT